ncbi:helix-hairpin-helix domain-containing protein [Bacillus paralicheniformis]
MKLPLTKKERSNLRTAKVKIKNTAYMDLSVLAHTLGSSLERAAYIKALAQFQTAPSIGPKMAQCAVDLGYYSLGDIKHESGADLIIRLEKLKGYWEDPCAEEMRCDASSITPTIPKALKAGGISQRKEKCTANAADTLRIDRQRPGTKKNGHKKSRLPNSSAALFASFTREFRVKMNGNVHKHYFWRNSSWL